jgi:hypothetical protein
MLQKKAIRKRKSKKVALLITEPWLRQWIATKAWQHLSPCNVFVFSVIETYKNKSLTASPTKPSWSPFVLFPIGFLHKKKKKKKKKHFRVERTMNSYAFSITMATDSTVPCTWDLFHDYMNTSHHNYLWNHAVSFQL